MKTIWLAFGMIFLAELGDKTQLAILAMKSRGLSGWGLFIGSMIAFSVLTALAIFFGGWLHTKIPIEIIQKVAAVSFIVIGLLMWLGKI
jgi:putative Ca2+/H+ antiporter (TMEM165/GDT1 family)